MSEFRNNTFINQRIDLDGNIFEGNSFEKCTLVYGGGPLAFNDNKLHDVSWEFVGAAGRTVAVLELLYSATGTPKDFIEKLLSGGKIEVLEKEDKDGDA